MLRTTLKPEPTPPDAHRIAIFGAALAVAVGYWIPVVDKLFLPLTYLNVICHETCHAIAGLLSGAQVSGITINLDGSGQTGITGGSSWIIGPAGYIGASVIGAIIIWFSRSERGAREVLRALAVLIGFAVVLWMRYDPLGLVAGIAWIAALFAASRYLKGLPLLLTAQFIGLQQCLNSLTAVAFLVNVSADGRTHSDALILQQQTGIPAMAWALGWCLLSFAMVGVTLARAWKGPDRPTGAPGSGR